MRSSNHELQGRKSCLDIRKNSLLVEGRQQGAERLGISVMEIFKTALIVFSLPATYITSLFQGLQEANIFTQLILKCLARAEQQKVPSDELNTSGEWRSCGWPKGGTRAGR